ncbi:DUF4214 domain-containing protein [Kribbella sp. NPDC020789]
MLRKPLAVALALTALLTTQPAQAAVATTKIPAQFVAKLYSEALGRMPEAAGWANAMAAFSGNQCTTARLGTMARGFYTSTEFSSRPYGNAAKVLTLYRGMLNRDPDQSGFDDYVRRLDAGTLSWPQLVDAFTASGEFAALSDRICGPDTSYYFGTAPAPTLPVIGTGFTGGTGAELQALLDQAPAGATIYLAQQAVVRVGAMITVPAGKTLATTGAPAPTAYALQGRLVRTNSFSDAMIRLQPGARLRNVWVDGQRGDYTNYVLGAMNIQLFGGTGTEVSGSKIENSRGWTNLQLLGSYEGAPCGGATVSGNLVTAYSSDHYPHGGVGRYTDGLSVACERSTIENNAIIDPTDVGIVLFRSSPATQQSTVRGNQVLSAGNSAYGAIAVDGLYDQKVTHDFTGSSIVGNAFWTGPDTHVDFGLAIGTRAWFGPRSDPGTGVVVRNNTTNGLTAVAGIGIAVTGMHKAVVQGNDLRLDIRSLNACPKGNLLVDADGYAEGGDYQPGATPASFTFGSGGCIGH